MLTESQREGLLRELSYQTSRSGGKGGQNVNKVESRVELSFDVSASEVLSARQKATILKKAPLISETLIKITASEHRSQLENKEVARKKFFELLDKVLKPVKKRVPTKPGKAARQKKLDEKKRNSQKKSNRQKNFPL